MSRVQTREQLNVLIAKHRPIADASAHAVCVRPTIENEFTTIGIYNDELGNLKQTFSVA